MIVTHPDTDTRDPPARGGVEPSDADRTAEFEALLQPLLGRAYGFSWSLTRNDADAEDLIQEAALLAFRGFASFRPGTNFKAWFYRILKNCYFMHCRRMVRRPATTSLDEACDFYMFARAAEAGLHGDGGEALDVISKLGVEEVAAAIGALPPEYRVVCTLFFLEELTYPEIAEVLECPIGTVRSRLHRARRNLQRALWHAAVDSGVVERPLAEVR